MPLKFSINKKLGQNSLGRAGTLITEHGTILTPAFVTVGTKATVKAMTAEQVASVGAQVVLANTYHLYLEPGTEIIAAAGGLGAFMNWRPKDGKTGPTMTDSGGFQVFSLGAAYGKGIGKVIAENDPSLLIPERSSAEEAPKLATVGSEGVSFKSHLDGSLHYFTPQKSMAIQHDLGADIIFTFDECTSPTETSAYQAEALERTHRWAKQCLEYHKSTPNAEHQSLFGIVQGGRDEKLRKESAQIIGAMDFDGFGIGGSFAKEDMSTAVRWVNEILPENKPRHLLGIGEPLDLFTGVENGVDLFDCVAPTRMGRNGSLYTKSGRVNLNNARFVGDAEPLETGCDCYTCQNYSAGYLAHLYRSKEMLAATLGSIHNLRFLIRLVEEMRQAILNDTFYELRDNFLQKYYPENKPEDMSKIN